MCNDLIEDLIEIKYLRFLKIDTIRISSYIKKFLYKQTFETIHHEINDFVEVAQNCKCRTEMKKEGKTTRRKGAKKEKTKKKKKKLRITGNEEERGKKRIVSWRPEARVLSSSLSPYSSPLPPLSSFYFHEGEEPVCIRGAERKNRKSEGKEIESRLAALPLLTGPTRRWRIKKNCKDVGPSNLLASCYDLHRRYACAHAHAFTSTRV